jgi:hypothetical protein
MKIIVACLLILAVVIISGCGQSTATPAATTPATGTVAEVAATPTSPPTAAPEVDITATPAADISPAAAPANTATVTSPPTVTSAAAPASEPEPTATPSPAAEPPTDEIGQEDIDAARQVVFDYWKAFNAYDLDGVLSFLEDSWRQESAESLKSDMGQLQAFGTTLGVSEEAEPTVTPDGKVEIKIKLKTPLGSRHVTYDLMKVNGEWKICYSEEQ